VKITDPAEYRKRIEDCLGGENISVQIETLDEAKFQKKMVLQQQKELRQIKRQISEDMKNIRAYYQQQSANVQPSVFGIFGQLVGKKGYARNEAAKEKRSIKQEQQTALQPYENIKRTIDNVILQLDRAKLMLTEYIKDESQ